MYVCVQNFENPLFFFFRLLAKYSEVDVLAFILNFLRHRCTLYFIFIKFSIARS